MKMGTNRDGKGAMIVEGQQWRKLVYTENEEPDVLGGVAVGEDEA